MHRPRYDDWSLPKGKQERGESLDDCARREVEEETGFVCDLGPELLTTSYVDAKGRPKEVRYWSMTVVSGAFAPNDEVDAVRWTPTDDIAEILSYPRDVDVIQSFVSIVG